MTPARASAPAAPRKPKKRPYGTEGWPEAEYQVWLQQPWWKRYRLGWNWPIAISSGLIALSIAIRELAK